MSEITITFLFGVGFVCFFGFIEFLYYRLRLKVELTRKLIHIGSGLAALSFPFVFTEFWSVALLCLAFLGILLVTKKGYLLRSIHAVDRPTQGSALFPVVVSVCFAIYLYHGQYLIYLIPLSILAICDPIAAWTGKKMGFGTYYIKGHQKSLAGNLGFFLSCLLLCESLLYAVPGSIFLSFLLALLCTMAEGLIINGFDNLSIPITALAGLYIFPVLSQPI
ncbi:MAG: hypothetical protein AAF694_00095 [Bacteroidota bacterium]